VGIKVKLAVCIIKYYTMKMYPVLNKAPCPKDVWRSRGIAPCILNPTLDGCEQSAYALVMEYWHSILK
jgi:hypothetical protein